MLKKFLIPVCLTLVLAGCSSKGPERFTTTVDGVMNTAMDLAVYADSGDVLDDATSLILTLDSKLSATADGSELRALNESGSGVLSDETAELLGLALDYCQMTGGVLDISILPVVQAWGFAVRDYETVSEQLPAEQRIPSANRLEELLSHVDYSLISFDPDSGLVTLPEDMKIDLGSVAKGYTGDCLSQLFRENGITSALMNLGGNVHTVGSKPDGSPWRIGVTDPLDKEGLLGDLSVTDCAVITSGGYERYFEDDAGNIYWHIIDPSTGYPAQNGNISVTVIGPNGTYCDALSTALFIMGPEGAIDYWRSHGDFDMILVTDDNRVLITPALTETFHLSEGSTYSLAVIDNA